MPHSLEDFDAETCVAAAAAAAAAASAVSLQGPGPLCPGHVHAIVLHIATNYTGDFGACASVAARVVEMTTPTSDIADVSL